MFREIIDKVLAHGTQLTTNQCSAVKLAMQSNHLITRRASEAAASETNQASSASLEMLFLLSSRVLELTCVVDDAHRQLRDVRKVVQSSEYTDAESLRTQRDVLLGADELIAVAASIRTQLQTIDRQLNAAV
jgi:hypothetical protein